MTNVAAWTAGNDVFALSETKQKTSIYLSGHGSAPCAESRK